MKLWYCVLMTALAFASLSIAIANWIIYFRQVGNG